MKFKVNLNFFSFKLKIVFQKYPNNIFAGNPGPNQNFIAQGYNMQLI